MSAEFRDSDYYARLQVDARAHPAVIQAAFRTLMRTLRGHPDLGGSTSDASRIIEAYGTLNDPARRRAYDGWLAAHSAPPAPAAPRVRPVDRVFEWIRRALPEFGLAVRAPFARAFDVVYEGPGWFRPRLYVKRYERIAPPDWPTIFILCRAVGVARQGLLPSTDLVLLVGERVESLDGLLTGTRVHSVPWAWNRRLVLVATLRPPALHEPRVFPEPRLLRRLRAALPSDFATRPA